MHTRCPNCGAGLEPDSSACPWCHAVVDPRKAWQSAPQEIRHGATPPYLALFVAAPVAGVLLALVALVVSGEAGPWLAQAWDELVSPSSAR